MAISNMTAAPTGEGACLNMTFFRKPPQPLLPAPFVPPPPAPDDQFFATTVDGEFQDGGAHLGYLSGPVNSFSAGGKLWSLVPKRSTESFVVSCSPGNSPPGSGVPPEDRDVRCAENDDACIEVKLPAGFPVLGNVCFTGDCGAAATSDDCRADLTLGTLTSGTTPGTADLCTADADCGGTNHCLPYRGCYRGTFESGEHCSATNRARCLPRFTGGTLGVMRSPAEAAGRPECAVNGDVTNCLRRALDGVDTLPGDLAAVTRPFDRWIVTSAAPDPRPPPRPTDGTTVLVWGRANFLAVRVDGTLTTPPETDWSPLDVFLWRYFVSSEGVISTPTYWCGDPECGVGGFSDEIEDAEPVLRERDHATGNQLSVFWAPPIQRWVMLYGGRFPFPTVVDEEGNSFEQGLPSLTVAQVFDTTAGIYVRHAAKPEGPWSAPRTIFNPYSLGELGYCDILYFSDAYKVLGNRNPALLDLYEALECPNTRTAQAWWRELTEMHYSDDKQRDLARLAYGAEYGAAVLPQLITQAPDGDGVSFHWLLSTWNPYRVVVMRTEFEP